MPRSRTYWTSRYLTYGPWQCGHDEIAHVRSLDDVRSWFSQPCAGTCETGASPFWRLVRQYCPDARVVTIRRDVEEVLQSLNATGLDFDERVMAAVLTMHDRKLDQIEHRVPGVMSIRYEDLVAEQTCARLFEHCLGLPHDHDWWVQLSGMNLQRNIHHTLRYYNAHAAQIEKVRKQAKHRMLAAMQKAPELDGVTFQTEPFRRFYEDARRLFAEHLAQTGQSPDDHMHKNLPLLQRLDDIGALHVMTGRSNGRMFSYLVSVIAPSLDSPDELLAEQTIFFADPSWPRLGMKTQQAAIEDLRAKGVHRVLMRAGHRGSGPRLGALFRRLGAEPFGNLYNLPLEMH